MVAPNHATNALTSSSRRIVIGQRVRLAPKKMMEECLVQELDWLPYRDHWAKVAKGTRYQNGGSKFILSNYSPKPDKFRAGWRLDKSFPALGVNTT
jgi:hypothetical protein